MSVSTMIPEFWSKSILSTLETSLVLGGPEVVNRDYEGEIANSGDTVRINSVGDIEITDYTRRAALGTPDDVDSTELLLLIDQAKKFNFKTDDLDVMQANADFTAKVQARAGYNLRKAADTFLATLMEAAVAPANDIGAVDVGTGTSETDAYDLLVDMGVVLDEADVPDDMRFAVVNPAFYGVLLKDDRFVSFGTSENASRLANGKVGAAAGFTIMKSNQLVTDASGAASILAGHNMATTYAEQIVKTETLRSESYFGDIVRGLHVYGAKVLYPEALATALVTID